MLGEWLASAVQQEMDESDSGPHPNVKVWRHPWQPIKTAVEYLGSPSRSDATVLARRSQAQLEDSSLFTSLHGMHSPSQGFCLVVGSDCGVESKGDTALLAIHAVQVSSCL
jgi:hypothetical protein